MREIGEKPIIANMADNNARGAMYFKNFERKRAKKHIMEVFVNT